LESRSPQPAVGLGTAAGGAIEAPDVADSDADSDGEAAEEAEASAPGLASEVWLGLAAGAPPLTGVSSQWTV